jgi:hypothetical protein
VPFKETSKVTVLPGFPEPEERSTVNPCPRHSRGTANAMTATTIRDLVSDL